uniref:Solute carrier family 46 member 2 n=1 Tax=Paramormyrops kingsleyae TaxID=1676925 RepID=A0A3B3QGR0_9TELE|nr:thymic stromal cotransporter homolog [Paramormyrops kingsleyae]
MECLASLRTRVHPVVVSAQIASALYDTGLQMVVKERCSDNSTATEEDRQKAISNFYMTYTMLSSLLPFVPAYFLTRYGDRGFRKVPIGIPLLGYLISRTLLLLVILLELPIEVMFGGAVVYGLCGGYSSYWAGVMALESASSQKERRSLCIMGIELAYGIAGFVGSLSSGHIFQIHAIGNKNGVVLVAFCIFLYFLCIIYTFFILVIPGTSAGNVEHRQEGNVGILWNIVEYPRSCNIVIVLLFISAILYDIAVAGGMEMLMSFIMKEPLNWGADQVGYSNAAGFVIFFTSFFGVWLFSKFVADAAMIMIGMVSFAAGIYFMSFVTATYLFYLARSLTLFALIPMPTIRSLLSKQVQPSSYGKILISLQLSFTLASLIYSPIYTKVYQSTLSWFPGFVFLLSSIITVLAIIPISMVGWRMARQEGYVSIEGD